MKIVDEFGFCTNLEINGFFFTKEGFLKLVAAYPDGSKRLKFISTGEIVYYDYKFLLKKDKYWNSEGSEI